MSEYSDEQLEIMRETLTKPGSPIPLRKTKEGYWVIEFLRVGAEKTECASTLYRRQSEAAYAAALFTNRYTKNELVYAVAVPVEIIRRSL